MKKKELYKPNEMIRVHMARHDRVEMPYKDLERFIETDIAKSKAVKRGEFAWWFERIRKGIAK